MKAIVTGGAGFIGSYVVRALLRRDYEVIVIDDLSYGLEENLPEHPRLTCRWSNFIGDLGSLFLMEEGKVDVVFHLAGIVGVGAVMGDMLTMLAEQAAAIELCKEAALHGATVVLASSSEVYGASKLVPFREDDVLVVPPSSVARSAYPVGKLFSEHAALAYARQGLGVTIARLFNVVGPRQRAREGCLLPRLIVAMLREEEFLIHGDGWQTRCFSHVEDVASVLVNLSRLPQDPNGRIVNVGCDHPMTVIEAATYVRMYVGEQFGRHGRLRMAQFSSLPPDEGWEFLRVRQPDLTRLRELTGLECPIPDRWSEIVVETCDYWAKREGIL